ncbi:hypothetical protein XENOCAPTIV_015105, partial [Xenoophorus captivus]
RHNGVHMCQFVQLELDPASGLCQNHLYSPPAVDVCGYDPLSRERAEEVYMSQMGDQFLEHSQPCPANICGMLQLSHPFFLTIAGLQMPFYSLQINFCFTSESVNGTGN